MERTHELADSFKEFFWQGVQQVHGCIQNKCNNLLRRHSYQRAHTVLTILSSWFGPFDKRGWWKLGKKANYISGNRKRKFYCIPYNSRTSRHKLLDSLTNCWQTSCWKTETLFSNSLSRYGFYKESNWSRWKNPDPFFNTTTDSSWGRRLSQFASCTQSKFVMQRTLLNNRTTNQCSPFLVQGWTMAQSIRLTWERNARWQCPPCSMC